MSTLGAVFTLLVIYQVKHFFADYPLQGEFMLRKFAKDPKIWVPALSAHAGVHALFTLAIAFFWVGPTNLPLALAFFDFVVHFAMDRIKASPSMLGRFKPLGAAEIGEVLQSASYGNTVAIRRLKHNTYFWWSLGFDQMVHHLSDLLIVFCLLSH